MSLNENEYSLEQDSELRFEVESKEHVELTVSVFLFLFFVLFTVL